MRTLQFMTSPMELGAPRAPPLNDYVSSRFLFSLDRQSVCTAMLELLGGPMKRIMIYVQPSASMFSQMTVLLILTGIVNARVEPFTTCEKALNPTVHRKLPSDSS